MKATFGNGVSDGEGVLVGYGVNVWGGEGDLIGGIFVAVDDGVIVAASMTSGVEALVGL
jgi:hypothetical protein